MDGYGAAVLRFVFTLAPRCGYCLEASMTDRRASPPVIADQVRNPEDRGVRLPTSQPPTLCHSQQSEESKISQPHDPRPVDTALKPA